MNRPGIALSALLCSLACSLSLVGSANSQTDGNCFDQMDRLVCCEGEFDPGCDQTYESYRLSECDPPMPSGCVEETEVTQPEEEEVVNVDYDEDGCYYETDWCHDEYEAMVQDVAEEEVLEPVMEGEEVVAADDIEEDYYEGYEYYEEFEMAEEVEEVLEEVAVEAEAEIVDEAINDEDTLAATEKMDEFDYESECEYYDEYYVEESLVDEELEMIDEEVTVAVEEEILEDEAVAEEAVDTIEETRDFDYESKYDYYYDYFNEETPIAEELETVDAETAEAEAEILEHAALEEEVPAAAEEMSKYDFESEYDYYYYDDYAEEVRAAEEIETVETDAVEFDYESNNDDYYDYYEYDNYYGEEAQVSESIAEETPVSTGEMSEFGEESEYGYYDDHYKWDDDAYWAEDPQAQEILDSETADESPETEIVEEELDTFDAMNEFDDEYEYDDEYDYYESYEAMYSAGDDLDVMEEEIVLKTEEEILGMDAAQQEPVDETSDFHFESEYDYYHQYYDDESWADEDTEAAVVEESIDEPEIAEETSEPYAGNGLDYDYYDEESWVMEPELAVPVEEVDVESSEPMSSEAEMESLGYDPAYDEAMFGESTSDLEPFPDPMETEKDIFEPIDPVLPMDSETEAAAERLKDEVIAFTARAVSRLRVAVKDAAHQLHDYAVAELPAMAALLNGKTRR